MHSSNRRSSEGSIHHQFDDQHSITFLEKHFSCSRHCLTMQKQHTSPQCQVAAI